MAPDAGWDSIMSHQSDFYLTIIYITDRKKDEISISCAVTTDMWQVVLP